MDFLSTRIIITRNYGKLLIQLKIANLTAKHEFAVWETNAINWWIIMTTRPAITDHAIQGRGRGGWNCGNHRSCITLLHHHHLLGHYVTVLLALLSEEEKGKKKVTWIAIDRERINGLWSSSIEDFPLYYRPSTGFHSITIIIIVISW